MLAFVETDYEEIYLTAAGERVDETTIDWSVQDEGPDAVAADGMVDCRLVTEKLEWTPCVTWYHNDPARDGLETHSEHRQRSRSAVTDVHLPGDGPAAGVAQGEDGESAEDRADRLATLAELHRRPVGREQRSPHHVAMSG